MDEGKRKYLEEDDLTDADRLVLRAYERADEPQEWDESDEAILAFARSIVGDDGTADSRGREGTSAPSAAPASGAAEAEEEGGVVAFKPRDKPALRRLHRSPLAGLALAASLVLGVFAGQGMIPYYDFGVAPGYQDLLRENERLTEEVTRTRSLQVRPPRDAGDQAVTSLGLGVGQIVDLLDAFECSDLSLTISSERQLLISGHVSTVNDLRRLDADLSGYQDVGRVVNDVIVYDWPFCEHLGLLGDLTILDPRGRHSPVVRPFDHHAEHVSSEAFVVEAIGTSLYEGYLYVDFIRQDGQVVHILPSSRVSDNLVPNNQKVLLDLYKDQHSPDKPYGIGMLSVITSPVPIFRGSRPDVEAVQAYYKDLRAALGSLVAQGHNADLLSAYSFVVLQEGLPPSARDR